MTDQDRHSGFRKRSIRERLELLGEQSGLDANAMQEAFGSGGLSVEKADKLVENVVGVYALPLSVALHLVLNGAPRIAPMVVEEPSVVAAASFACKLVGAGGGFEAECDPPVMIAQVQFDDVPDMQAACAAIEQARDQIVSMANEACPDIVRYGGGCRSIELRPLDAKMLVVHLLVDCRDAMGANTVNTMAEAVGPWIAEQVGAQLGLRILSNLADRRCVRVRCRVPSEVLATRSVAGERVIEGIERASRFAEADPYRAATHNKGIMNGIDPVVIATGNDWRAIEAGAHAFAARSGSYRPLSVWRAVREGSGTWLQGQLELPMALGVVGGTLVHHRAAALALKLAKVKGASDLAALAASVGLASNLAALRALSTEGIQRGHMSLHARSVAMSAGAQGAEIDQVAREISAGRDVSIEAAHRALRVIRGQE